jgi:hypothetical protein
MSNASINLTSLDFELIKQNLKEYLKSQKIFQDYDFEASNINVLLDVLAYNSQLTGFYLNMIGSEMFLDSALLRDSVVSHAKELNYLPRSFRSASAVVDITLVDNSPDISSVVIPRGTSFTGKLGNRSFTFVTDQNIPAQSIGGNVFNARNVALYEGDYTFDSYVVNNDDTTRYIITNKTVDTNSITVTILEDNGAIAIPYFKANNLFELTSQSPAFFIQAAENDSYEIVFGDGVIGRRPKDRSIIMIQYRACNGELPNGIRNFSADGNIGTSIVTNVVTRSSATGGSIPESITSIKFNAPRAFTTQERVVTARDYETLLLNNFSEINAVSAYGGEEANPPQYGKVIVAVDLKTTDRIPPSLASQYRTFVKSRSPLSIDPVFVEPDYTYIKVKTVVKYNINQSGLNVNDIASLVFSTIQNFNIVNLNGFNKTLYYSRLVGSIDTSQLAIVSNDTELQAIKTFVPAVRINSNYDIDFGMTLRDDIAVTDSITDTTTERFTIIKSSPFIFNNLECFLEDDGRGNIHIMSIRDGRVLFLKDIGTVNYETGFIQIANFAPQQLVNNKLDLFAITREKDITSQRKTILSIRDEDINVRVEQVRI